MTIAQITPGARGARLGRWGRVAALSGGATTLLGLVVALVIGRHGATLIDFKGGLWAAGRAILAGRDPYQPAFLAHQVQIMRAGGPAIGVDSQSAFSVPLYPAPINLAVVPLSLLPLWLAGAIYTVLSVGAVILALRLFGVRDRRCFAVALGSWPCIDGLLVGSLGPWLLLGCGVAWRHRDRVWPPALAVAAVVVAKLFPWPLGVWLLVTRRYRAAAVSVAVGVGVTLAAWLVIGLRTLASYPQMLANASTLQSARSDSPSAILIAYGVSPGLATAVGLLLAAGLLAAATVLARRPMGDRHAFALAIIAALAASPIVWSHYLVLLLGVIALVSPQLSPIWFAPLFGLPLMGAAEAILPASPHDTLALAAPWVLIEALVAVIVLRSGFDARARTVRAPRGRPSATSARVPG